MREAESLVNRRDKEGKRETWVGWGKGTRKRPRRLIAKRTGGREARSQSSKRQEGDETDDVKGIPSDCCFFFCFVCFMVFSHTHTHTHTHIYIYTHTILLFNAWIVVWNSCFTLFCLIWLLESYLPYLLCFVFVFMDFLALLFFFFFFFNLIAITYCSLRLSHYVHWWAVALYPCFDLRHRGVSELWNDVVKGERNVYAWRNGQCWVGSSIPEYRCGAWSPLPGWLWGGIWEIVLIVFDIYVYSVLLKIHGDWQQDAGDGWKSFLGLTVIKLGWGTRGHIFWDPL